MGILEDYMRQQAEARAQAQAQAKRDALLAMGMSLLGTRKGRELEGLGKAGLLGLATARNTNIPEGPSLRDMLAMQEYEAKQQERAAAQAEQQAMRGAATASIVGGSPEMGPPTPGGALQPATPGQFDPAQYVQRLYQMGRVNEAMAVEKQYAKPPKKLKDVKTLMQGGKRVTVNFYDDGSQEVLPFDPDAEKLHFADAGGIAGVGLDPFTGKPVSAGITKTMTQAERDASARGWANVKIAQQSAGNTATNAVIGKAGDLRKEFNALPQVKAYGEVQPVLQSVREAMNTDTAAADLNLIYGAAKIFDPTSVVRESETTMVVQSGSPAQRFLGQFNYVAGGGRLTPEARKQLIAQIESRGRGYESGYKAARKAYEGVADKVGVPKDQVFIEPFAPSDAAPARPAAPTAPTSKADYDRLPSGATYTAPDGTTRRKR